MRVLRGWLVRVYGMGRVRCWSDGVKTLGKASRLSVIRGSIPRRFGRLVRPLDAAKLGKPNSLFDINWWAVLGLNQ